MREIVHIQAGQCGNQIGAKVRLSRLASCVPTRASPGGGGGERGCSGSG